MTAKTHLVSALLVASAVPVSMGYHFDYGKESLLYLLAAGLGGTIVDIDESNSAWGRKLGIVSKAINASIGHRTYTHNLFIAAACIVGGWFFSPFLIAFGLGMATHIITDGMTGNVRGALWPLRSHFYTFPKRRVIAIGGIAEYAILSACIVLLAGIHLKEAGLM